MKASWPEKKAAAVHIARQLAEGIMSGKPDESFAVAFPIGYLFTCAHCPNPVTYLHITGIGNAQAYPCGCATADTDLPTILETMTQIPKGKSLTFMVEFASEHGSSGTTVTEEVGVSMAINFDRDKDVRCTSCGLQTLEIVVLEEGCTAGKGCDHPVSHHGHFQPCGCAAVPDDLDAIWGVSAWESNH